MKLAFSTNAYKQHTLEQAVASIASLGYAGVEIMADRPHAWTGGLTADRMEEIAALIANAGMAASNVNAFTTFAIGDTYHPSWIEEHASDRSRRVGHTRQAIELAARINARNVSVEPGGPLEGVKRELAPLRFRQGLEALLPLAESLGVTIAIEPEPGLMIERTQEYMEFIQDLQSPALSMNLDLGHMYCVGEDPAEVIRRLRGEYCHVHLEDIAASRVHQHLVPGKGAMDFDAIFDALRSVAYEGWITVELYPYESTAEAAAKQAKTFLARYGF
ncbi:MAG: Fructoselysine 3-epimerase [Phycisphaerae bacterium]|nr:Fructoselysine 3-epimerase [Phycisphaerae bacterium]